MPNRIRDRKPTETGRYSVLARLADGTTVEQTDVWRAHPAGGWWGDGRCGAEEQAGAVVAWRESNV